MKLLGILITTLLLLAFVCWLLKGWWRHSVVEDRDEQKKMLDNVVKDGTP